MKSKRRKFSAQFKAKVAVEALKERESLSELSRRYEVHPNMISNRIGGRWKNEFLDNSSTVFEKERDTEQETVPDRGPANGEYYILELFWLLYFKYTISEKPPY